jgi:hypothetical protein
MVATSIFCHFAGSNTKPGSVWAIFDGKWLIVHRSEARQQFQRF